MFLDDVFVPADHLVGDLHQGWAVANATLAHERGTSFPFKDEVVHEVYLDELGAWPTGGAASTIRWWRRLGPGGTSEVQRTIIGERILALLRG